MHLPAARRDRAHREGRVVAAGQRHRGEAAAGRHPRRDPVDAERAPLARRGSRADEVPAALPAEQPVRLDEPRRRRGSRSAATRRRGSRRRSRASTAGSTSGSGASVPVFSGARSTTVAERLDRGPQPGRQHLLELRQRAGARLGDARRRPVRGAQPDRDGDGLLVVEEQRRQLAAGAEPVAAGARRGWRRRGSRARAGVRCRCGWCASRRQAGGELGAGPVGPRLQQREQGEQPARQVSRHASLDLASRLLGTINVPICDHSVDVMTNTDQPPPPPTSVPSASRSPRPSSTTSWSASPAPGCPQPAPGDDWDARHPEPYLREAVDRWRTRSTGAPRRRASTPCRTS